MSIGFPVCPECGGSGHDLSYGPPHAAQGVNPPDRGTECTYCKCPSCVEGAVITDELVEAGARALWEADAESIRNEETVSHHMAARAVLAAVLRHLKAQPEITHKVPDPDTGIVPCCGQTPFELPRMDRMTLDDDLVTCPFRHLKTEEQ